MSVHQSTSFIVIDHSEFSLHSVQLVFQVTDFSLQLVFCFRPSLVELIFQLSHLLVVICHQFHSLIVEFGYQIRPLFIVFLDQPGFFLIKGRNIVFFLLVILINKLCSFFIVFFD